MSIVTILMALVLVGMLLLAEMLNMILTAEYILIMLFMLPVYLYKRSDTKMWNTYLFMMNLMVIVRYVTSTFVVKYAKVVTLPISVDVELIRQFNGIGVIAIWFLWYAIVFASTVLNNKALINSSATADEIKANKDILHNNSFFSVTAFVFIVNLIIAIFVYDIGDLKLRMGINIVIVLITIATHKYYIQKTIIDRIIEIKENTNIEGKRSKCKIYDMRDRFSNTDGAIDAEVKVEQDNATQENDEQSGGEE